MGSRAGAGSACASEAGPACAGTGVGFGFCDIFVAEDDPTSSLRHGRTGVIFPSPANAVWPASTRLSVRLVCGEPHWLAEPGSRVPGTVSATPSEVRTRFWQQERSTARPAQRWVGRLTRSEALRRSWRGASPVAKTPINLSYEPRTRTRRRTFESEFAGTGEGSGGRWIDRSTRRTGRRIYGCGGRLNSRCKFRRGGGGCRRFPLAGKNVSAASGPGRSQHGSGECGRSGPQPSAGCVRYRGLQQCRPAAGAERRSSLIAAPRRPAKPTRRPEEHPHAAGDETYGRARNCETNTGKMFAGKFRSGQADEAGNTGPSPQGDPEAKGYFFHGSFTLAGLSTHVCGKGRVGCGFPG